MRYTLFLLLLPNLLFAQPFQQETNTIPVEINGWQPHSPWTLGYNFSDPELCDIDGDGDFDFFVGNSYPNIAFFQNDGTINNPDFDWITNNYENLQSPGYLWNSSPVLCDIDSDGDSDLFIACLSNISNYYENIGSPSQPFFILRQDTLKDSGGSPVYGMYVDLVDIDSDGDKDFFGGRYTGVINFYRNIGTPDSFSFSLDEYEFANINLDDDVCPYFLDIDYDSDIDLLIGHKNGNVYFYENIGDSANWDFQFVTSQFEGIDVYKRATPEARDIDGDGDLDLFSGRETEPAAPRGNIFYWHNQGNPFVHDFEYITSDYLTMDEGYGSDPDFCDIDDDGDYDMFLASGTNMSFYRNIGTVNSAAFTLVTEDYFTFEGEDPFFYDIDNDGDYDCFKGSGDWFHAEVIVFRNIGTPQEANFIQWFSVSHEGPWQSEVCVADIDADGDGDLFFGDNWGDFYYFENIGTVTNPSFDFVAQNFQNIDYPTTILPYFYDWDEDGDFDLFIGGGTYNMSYYENVGSPLNMQLQLITHDFFEELYGALLRIKDIDADTDPDFFFSLGRGGVIFVRNLAVNAINPRVAQHPLHGIELSFGPNPANPVTWVSFNLPYPQKAELAVYNLLGQKVATLASGYKMPGTRTYFWNAINTSSGTYFIRLETELSESTHKVTVVK